MNGILRTSKFLFYGLAAIVVVVSIVSFVNALTWINRPFSGFLLYDFPLVGSMNLSDWPGRQAGMKALDRIVTADGHPVFRGRDLVELMEEKSQGAAVEYVLETKVKTRTVKIPVINFGFREFILVFFLTFLGGLAILSLGCTVYILKPNVSTSWVFFLFCFFLSLYMVTSFEIQSTYNFVNIHYFALCLMSALGFHLGLVFPEKKKILNRLPILEYLIYLPALFLAVGYQIYLFNFEKILVLDLKWWIPDYRSLVSFNRSYTLFCLGGMIGALLHSTIASPTILGRRRSRLILLGLTLAFAPSVTLMALVFYLKIDFPWNFLVFFVLFFPASIAYSIVKHNLFDADTIIKRTVGYVVVTGIVVGAYVIVSVVINVFLGKYQLSQSKAFPIVFTLCVILVFNPLRDRIQILVDRIFFRKAYDYGEIIDKISSAMTSLLDRGQIIKRLVSTFMGDMFIDTSSVMLLNSAAAEYRVLLAEGDSKQDIENFIINREDPLIKIIEEEKHEITKFDVLESPKYRRVSAICAATFDALRASLLVPLVYQEKVIGLFSLGEMKSGKFYNSQDIDLLNTISNQGAVAIENARLFEENLEKQRMEEELAIAHELQTSMLPATCPKIEGFEIAAVSISAREVGGDFYDFIEMGATKVGFVIGDVTGKSVSGALVMSASRSVFRMLSDDELSVGDSMTRANKRIKKDIKSGMFVALLYAILDTRERSLSLCSAGQTQPIHLSARTGEVHLVETKGDTFPLGILEDVQYEETRFQLQPGDKIIFYTDGIVEAMNTQEEMFGFDRLLEVVQNSASMSADALLQEINDRVNEFVDGFAQHDDLTVIVINVAGQDSLL
jgi:sigma-B regulation protein RsbU (phosphoserine phosphatase)